MIYEGPAVLIVEDDRHLAEITCETIQAEGLQAVFRTSLSDALDYLAGNSAHVCAVLTDINLMSPMGGIELAVYVAEEWPNIAIGVMSGLALERPSRLPLHAVFLPKPWRLEELLNFVQGAFDKHA